jgi:hypothetical protein
MARGTTCPWLRTRYSSSWNSRQEFDVVTGARRGPRHEVEFEIADPQHRLLDDGIAAPRQRLDAREQFREGERLDEIIVAAGAKPPHPIVDLAQRAQNQGRRDDPLLPQAADDGQSVDAGQQAIDGHHRIFAGPRAREPFIAVAGEIDLIAAARQRIGELFGGLRVVFDNENAAPRSRHFRLQTDARVAPAFLILS